MALAVLASLALATSRPLAAQSSGASPAPSPSATATATSRPSFARPAPTEVHRAIVVCDREPFYVWPDRSSAPRVSNYSQAIRNESFNVIGDGTLADGQITLYETTIDTFAPYGGGGQHFWIRAACVNAG